MVDFALLKKIIAFAVDGDYSLNFCKSDNVENLKR